jgi:hypothetical protein
LPRWIKQYSGADLNFQFSSGGSFPADLSPYNLVIHCGGCMLNEREMKYRLRIALAQHRPMSNFGIIIAHMQGILKRSLTVFPHLAAELED